MKITKIIIFALICSIAICRIEDEADAFENLEYSQLTQEQETNQVFDAEELMDIRKSQMILSKQNKNRLNEPAEPEETLYSKLETESFPQDLQITEELELSAEELLEIRRRKRDNPHKFSQASNALQGRHARSKQNLQRIYGSSDQNPFSSELEEEPKLGRNQQQSDLLSKEDYEDLYFIKESDRLESEQNNLEAFGLNIESGKYRVCSAQIRSLCLYLAQNVTEFETMVWATYSDEDTEAIRNRFQLTFSNGGQDKNSYQSRLYTIGQWLDETYQVYLDSATFRHHKYLTYTSNKKIEWMVQKNENTGVINLHNLSNFCLGSMKGKKGYFVSTLTLESEKCVDLILIRID